MEAGETFHITRDGLAIAELRPAARRARFTNEELVERHRRLPRVDREMLRREADSFLGADILDAVRSSAVQGGQI